MTAPTKSVPLSRINPNGDEQLVGTAGSLIFSCPKCGSEHFRSDYYAEMAYGTCFVCKPLVRMEPVLIRDLETKWKPLWEEADKPSRAQRMREAGFTRRRTIGKGLPSDE